MSLVRNIASSTRILNKKSASKMRIETNFEKCILCMERPIDSWEHIIPDFLGGRLKAWILCKKCNNDTGRNLIKTLKNDSSIHIAIENLKPQLPELWDRVTKRLPYYGEGDNGSVIEFARKGKGLKLISSKGAKGSRILGPSHGERKLASDIKKLGLSYREEKKLLESFVNCPLNSPFILSDGKTFIKREVGEIKPQIKGCFVEERALALIAYEFLSLLIGHKIYSAHFDELREYILEGTPSERFDVSTLCGRKYEPYHVVFILPKDGSFTIVIRFFQWLVYEVNFHRFRYEWLNFVYLENLKKRQIWLAETSEDARNNLWYIF